MVTNRLEAFSDGVLAIIITIMVLELEVPHETDWAALADSGPSFLTYALSFVYVGIYWNNHHHMFQVVGQVTGGVLWGNLHLLFWLSLLPFSTKWMDESGFEQTPTIVYGLNLLAAALAYYVLQLSIFAGPSGERLQEALGTNAKGKLSPVLYVVGIALSFIAPWLAVAMFVVAALIWLAPDRRMERYLTRTADSAT